MQSRIEGLLKSQAYIRRLYRDGFIDMAICEYDATILPELGAIDTRISACARRLSRSFIAMVDRDLLAPGQSQP